MKSSRSMCKWASNSSNPIVIGLTVTPSSARTALFNLVLTSPSKRFPCNLDRTKVFEINMLAPLGLLDQIQALILQGNWEMSNKEKGAPAGAPEGACQNHVNTILVSLFGFSNGPFKT